MANTNSKHTVTVTDNGTLKALTSEAKQLNKELDKSQKATGARTPNAVAAARAARQMEEGRESNLARGVQGVTGAASRDFAKQAEGLGGLVRLYATFAANVFAATAALTALSRAADTTNMVSGLNQLGAASGRSLGNLAQKLSLATDNAVSLRESMESVAKASSAGLNNKQILELGDAAKKASQALGVNMTDSLSRLTRGISKLEPELLDELGIFVKIDQATANYARSVGKAANSLTDFERRQAFAIEVLKQAKDKFGEINIDANPYTKLLATFQNVMQVGLELVNKVLGPIVKLLAESPTALTAVIAGIGTMLLKQAMPAFGAWREGLRNTAKEAAKTAAEISKSMGDRQVAHLENIFNLPNLRTKVAEAQKEIDKLSAKRSDITGAISRRSGLASVSGIGSKDEEASLKEINRLIERKQKKEETGMAGSRDMSNAEKAKNSAELRDLKLISTELERQIMLKARQMELTKSQTALEEAQNRAQKSVSDKRRWTDTEELWIKKEKQLRQSAVSSAIISQAADTGGVLGIRAAFAEIKQSAEKEGIGGMRRFYTYAAGGAAAVTSRLLGIVGALGNIGLAIGAAIGLFTLFDTWLSNSAKSAEKLNASMESLEEAGNNLDRTLEKISKKDALGALNSQSVQARATAVAELTAAIEDTYKAFTKKREDDNWWDRLFVQFPKAIVGLDDTSKAAKTLGLEITKILRTTTGSNRDNLVTGLKEVVGSGVNVFDSKDLSRSITDVDRLMKALSPTLITISKEQTELANKTRAVDEAFESAAKTYDTILVNSLPTDPVAKLGFEFLKLGQSITASLTDTSSSLAMLSKIVTDVSTLRFFDPDTAESVLKQRDSIKKVAEEYVNLKNAVTIYTEALNKVPSNVTSSGGRQLTGKALEINARRGEARNALQLGKDTAQAELNKKAQEIAKYDEILIKGMNNAFRKGGELIKTSLESGFAKATIMIAKAYSGLFTGDSTAGITLEAKLRSKETAVQLGLINSNLQLIQATDNLTLVQEKLAARDRAEKATDEKTKILWTRIAEKLEEAQKTGRYSGNNARIVAQNDLNSGDEASAYAAGVAIPGLARQTALRGEAAQIRARDEAGKVEDQIKTSKVNLDLEMRLREMKQSKLSLDSKALEYSRSIVSANSQNAVLEEARIKAALVMEPIEKSILEKRLKIADLEKKVTTAPSDVAAQLSIELEGARFELIRQQIIAENKRKETQLDTIELVRSANAKLYDEIVSKQQELISSNASINESRISVAEQELSTLSSLNLLQDSVISKKRSELEIEKEKANYAKIVSDLTFSYSKRAQDLTGQIAALEGVVNTIATEDDATAGNAELARIKELRAELDGLSAIYQNQIGLIGKLSETRQRDITLLEKYNSMLALMGKIGELLTSAFGKVGTAIAGFSEALMQSVQQQEILNNKLTEIRDKKREIEDDKTMDPNKKTSELRKLGQLEIALNKKSADQQLEVNAKVIASTKTLFKEKTFAYKALDAIEKALHIARLVRLVVENKAELAASVQKSITSAKNIASDIAEASVSGVKAIINAFSAPFPMGFVAGAAMAAIIATLMSQIGGKKPPMPGGFTSESMQKTQGTGQDYVNGELTNTNKGILGDPTAKADSLSKSIDLIEEHTFSTLEYSNDMLENLKGINKNTKGLANILLQQGLNLKYVKPDGTFTNKTVKQENTPEWFGKLSIGSQLFGENSWFGKTNAKISAALFGKTTTESLANGIQALGKLSEIAINTFDNIKITQSSGALGKLTGGLIGGKDSVQYKTELGQVQGMGEEVIRATLQGISDLTVNAFKTLGLDVSDTVSQYIFDFKVDLKDKKPEEIMEILTSEFSSEFNGIVNFVTTKLEAFRDPGEELGETLVRLARNSEVVDLSLKSLGMSMSKDSDWIKNIVNVQNVIDKFGSVDAFKSKTDFFRDNFLTEEQKLAPIRSSVTAEMTRLGHASVDTIEEFTNLVMGLDLTKASSLELFHSLMNVQEGFYAVYQETKKVTRKPEEIAKDKVKQDIEILKLLGKTNEALNMQRWEEYKVLEDVLKPGQERIWQLQDELNALRAYNEILAAAGYSYVALMNQRKEELRTLTDSERAIKEIVYYWQDWTKSNALVIELLKAQGKEQEALNAERDNELKALRPIDQLLKLRIWKLQDEAKLLDKQRSQQVRILELLGKKNEALNITRRQELDTLDERLRPAQEYIYALEDQATLIDELKAAYDKQSSSIKTTIKSLKDSINALKEYRDNLLTGDKSILNPTEKYKVAKQKALELAAIASGPAETEAQIERRDDALSKLTGATDAWLEASRTLFASSDNYTNDFNTVLGILDSVSGILDSQISDAERQLTAIVESNDILKFIKDNTRTTTEILTDIYTAQQNTAMARSNYMATGGSSAKLTASSIGPQILTATQGSNFGIFGDDTVMQGKSGDVFTIGQLKNTLKDNYSQPEVLVDYARRNGITSAMIDSLFSMPAGTTLAWATSKGLPAFANGGLASGLAMVGEQGREIVDFSNPGRVYSAGDTAVMLNNSGSIVDELKQLRQEVATLRREQHEQTGDLIKTNYDANIKNAEMLKAANDGSNWNQRNAVRLM